MRHLLIDSETGGLNAKTDALLQLYMGVVDEHLNIIDECNLYIHSSNLNASKEALDVNKINLEEHNMIAMDRTLAYRLTIEFLDRNTEDCILRPMGHNVKFDLRFLEALISLETMNKYLSVDVTDTKEIAAQKIRLKEITATRTNLGEMVRYYGIEFDGQQHSARTDAIATLEVYKRFMGIKPEVE